MLHAPSLSKSLHQPCACTFVTACQTSPPCVYHCKCLRHPAGYNSESTCFTFPAWFQISAIKALLGDLRGGLSKVNTEILKAAGVDANSAFAHRQFGDLMMAFHQHAKGTFSDAEVCSATPPPLATQNIYVIMLLARHALALQRWQAATGACKSRENPLHFTTLPACGPYKTADMLTLGLWLFFMLSQNSTRFFACGC